MVPTAVLRQSWDWLEASTGAQNRRYGNSVQIGQWMDRNLGNREWTCACQPQWDSPAGRSVFEVGSVTDENGECWEVVPLSPRTDVFPMCTKRYIAGA